MDLSFYKRVGESPDGEQVSPEVVQLVLSPCHPDLFMTDVEAGGGRGNNEVLHVRVQRGRDMAHLHFSVGINDRGQLFGEVAAVLGNEPPRRCSCVAKWRPPVKQGES